MRFSFHRFLCPIHCLWGMPRFSVLPLFAALFTGCIAGSNQKNPGAAFDLGAVFATRTPTLTKTIRVGNTTNRPVHILGE